MPDNGIALDTSVLVAALQSWHREHTRARKAVARVLQDRSAIVPVHVVLETYSVLTRMPKSRRVAPEIALAQLERTLGDKVKLVHPEPSGALGLLQDLVSRGVTGGATYDAWVAMAAFQGGARTLLTLNLRDFRRVAPAGLTVESP